MQCTGPGPALSTHMLYAFTHLVDSGVAALQPGGSAWDGLRWRSVVPPSADLCSSTCIEYMLRSGTSGERGAARMAAMLWADGVGTGTATATAVSTSGRHSCRWRCVAMCPV